MTLYWDQGRDDRQDDYIAHISGDINKRLAAKCIATQGMDISFFYVSRRHILEILPEFILALLVIIPAALTLPLALEMLWLSFPLGLLILAAVIFFIFEIWRWDNEIVYISQASVNHRRWDWAKFQWDKDEYPFGNITTAKTTVPLEFNISKIGAGQVVITLNSGNIITLPLTPSPARLTAKIDQARRHSFAGHNFTGSSPWQPPVIAQFRD